MEQLVKSNSVEKFKVIASTTHTLLIFQIFKKKKIVRKSSKPGAWESASSNILQNKIPLPSLPIQNLFKTLLTDANIFLCKKLAFFVENDTFTQTISLRTVLLLMKM